jgi:hypothetical protein
MEAPSMNTGADATTELAQRAEAAQLEDQRRAFPRNEAHGLCDRCDADLSSGMWCQTIDSENAIGTEWCLCRSCSRLLQRFLMSGRAEHRLGGT